MADSKEENKEEKLSDMKPKEEELNTHSMDNASEQAQEQGKGAEAPPAPPTEQKLPKPIKETPAQKIERLEQENADLKAIAASQPTLSPADSKYMQDMAFFDKQKVGAGKIQVKEITDHKNISLWTPWGKRIGPLHPHNARHTYMKFRKLGRVLYVQKPTEDQIQAYYKTPEYKAWKIKEDENRARKRKSRGKGELDKILDAMVKITGQTKGDLQGILDKPVAAGGVV
jgi:hypothetical protein